MTLIFFSTLGLTGAWVSVVLAQVTAPAVQPMQQPGGLFIPFAILTVGLGIIGTLLKVSFSMGSASTKVTADVTALVTALNGVKEELKAESAARERDRATDLATRERDRAEARTANEKLEKAFTGAVERLEVAVTGLADRTSDLELRMARAEGAAEVLAQAKKTGAA